MAIHERTGLGTVVRPANAREFFADSRDWLDVPTSIWFVMEDLGEL